jgi:hypothetical protein
MSTLMLIRGRERTTHVPARTFCGPSSTRRVHGHDKVPSGNLDLAVTRALVDAQFGEWSDLTIEEVPAGGTVNAIFRLGDGLVARFWLEADDLEETRSELLTEVEAARELAGKTRFATPTPVARPINCGTRALRSPSAPEPTSRCSKHCWGTRRRQ